MKLHVEPKIALVDEKLTICLTALEPNEKVKVTASMVLPWAPSEKYESYALFTANEQGNIDLSKQKPDSGTYDWVDSMGLISSLQKVSSKGADITHNLSIDNHLCLDISAEHREGKETVTVERMFKTPDIKRQKINDPFVGELFYTGNPNHKTIILLGGSSGDMEALALLAAPLASHSFNVLNVAYFAGKGLPEYLQNVPLEYFEKVVLWIKENPLLNNEIYLHGTSKGGELALLLASRYDVFSKVVANLPHAYCFQGLQGMAVADNVSSWSYDGVPLPYIQLDNNVFFEEQKSCIGQNKPFGLTGCHIKGLEMAENKEEARIKVENANADILLITAEKDNMWNTYDGCRVIMDALLKHNYQHEYKLLSYKEMGHVSITVPFLIPISELLSIKMGSGIFSLGGTLEGGAYGLYDSWIKTLEFLKQ